MDNGSVKVHEAKLMIVGEPGAGKTTLRRKLIDPDAEMPKKQETTRGIDIDKWEYNYEKNNYTVNLWDFGGQEILQSTHQFFMCERALYVLLGDTRTENTDYFDWLHRIELFAGNSPTVIIHNEIGDRNRQINMSKIRKHFSNIPDPMRCNLDKINGTDREKDFYNIVDALKHKIKHLEVIGQEFPKAWIDLRNELEKIHKEGKLHYISSERYFTLCDKFKINKDSALTLSRYLHAIGAILFFDNDPILKHTVILNPEWGTDAVYKVIEDTKVQSNNGKFYKKDIKRIWANPIYKDKYDELLRLMINFKICYKVTNCYILPQLLPYQPEDAKYQWDSDSNLYFEYRYPDYYLNSIMIRFIVVMNEYIESQKTVWCNGVILSKGNDRAEIIADKEIKTIHIRVSGTTRRDFLTIIRKEFDDIHKQYKKLKVEQMVPCNCPDCISSDSPALFEIKTLDKYKQDQIPDIRCSNHPRNLVLISNLLDDFPSISAQEKINYQYIITANEVQINPTDINGDNINCINTMGDRNKLTSSIGAR